MYLDIEILKDLLTDFGGNVTFDTPCTVKMTPHTSPIRVIGLMFDYDGKTMVAIGEIKIEVDSPTPLSNTLIQRLKLMQLQK